MNKKRGFIPYDGFKLIVAIILLLIIIGLWMTFSAGRGAPPVTDVAEAVIAKPTATKEIAPTLEPMPVVEEEEVVEELPLLPEPSEGLSYDVESGFVVNADGEALYSLNEAGTGWVPIVPDDMNMMQLSSDGKDGWTLGDDDGIKYTWDFATHSWVEVPQEEVVEEPAEAEVIPECVGASPPQLSTGGETEVVSNVNFRSSPGISDNWLATLQVGSRLKVLGNPTCLPHGNGAYLWWQLEREDGSTGWTAEAPISGTNYFIAPAE